MVHIRCLSCSVIFIVPQYRENTAKFCSMKCYGVWQASNEEILDRLRKFGFQKGDKVRLGCHHTEEAKRKVGMASRGRKPTEKQLAALKIGWYLKGKSHIAWNKGKKFSEKYRRKLSKAHIGKHHPKSIKALEDYRKKHGGYLGEDNPNWRGGYYQGKNPPDYGSNWAKQRILARDRDNYTCQLCRIREDSRQHDVHHIIPFTKFESYEEANRLENLITLCSQCHRKVNWHPELLDNGRIMTIMTIDQTVV